MEITLSEKIEFLTDNGYTQTELAVIVGCGQSMLSMMKSGYEPKNQRLEKKIDALFNHERRRL